MGLPGYLEEQRGVTVSAEICTQISIYFRPRGFGIDYSPFRTFRGGGG